MEVERESNEAVARLQPALSDERMARLEEMLYQMRGPERTRALVLFAEEIRLGNLACIRNSRDQLEFFVKFHAKAKRARWIAREGLAVGDSVRFQDEARTIRTIAKDFTLRLTGVSRSVSPYDVKKVE